MEYAVLVADAELFWGHAGKVLSNKQVCCGSCAASSYVAVLAIDSCAVVLEYLLETPLKKVAMVADLVPHKQCPRHSGYLRRPI
jgi:hypothetical protein